MLPPDLRGEATLFVFFNEIIFESQVENMKIIKDGDIPNKVKFKCDKCNCVFVAGAGEFEFVDKYDKPINTNVGKRMKTQCPYCLHEVFKDKTKNGIEKDTVKKLRKIRNTVYLSMFPVVLFINFMVYLLNKFAIMSIISFILCALSMLVAILYAADLIDDD